MADDKQILQKQKENAEKLIQGLCADLRNSHLLNSDSIAFGLKGTPNGPALVIRGKFEPNRLKDGWQYTPNYLLDGNYGKEGLYRMKDGKHEFIPIVHESSKDMVAIYRKPDDIRNGILAVNSINPSQIFIDSTSGRAEIKLVGVVGDIRMPQGLEMEGGKVVVINDYDNSLVIKRVAASEITSGDVAAGSERSYTESIAQAPYMRDVYDYKEQPSQNRGNVSLQSFLDYGMMQRVYSMYCRDDAGNVITREKDGNDESFATEQVDDSAIIIQYQIAEMWVKAYKDAYKLDNNNDGIICTREDFQESMATIYACKGKNISDIAEALFHVQTENDKIDIIRTVLYFVSNPLIAREFSIVMDMTPDEAISRASKFPEQYLEEKWGDLVGEFRNEPSLDGETSMVMEKMGPQLNPVKNNGGSNY